MLVNMLKGESGNPQICNQLVKAWVAWGPLNLRLACEARAVRLEPVLQQSSVP